MHCPFIPPLVSFKDLPRSSEIVNAKSCGSRLEHA